VAAVRGLDEYPCAILPVEGTLTAMQMMAMDTVWWGAPHRLFQPVPFPELEGWSVARQCTDRIDLIMGWLRQNSISFGSFLDIGSSYGWFVSEMAKRGFQASGVEQDAAIAAVGPVAYGLDALAVTVANLGNFLRSAGQKYDVVCCLSILHNYLLGSQKMSATEFIRLIDQITGSVLFFDTAECHESRFKHSLSGWNADYIRSWLREHTSFSKIELLGTDSDGYGVFRKQYGRHLFACSRQL
jgi:SAM-dependent methyltransferase